MTQQKKPNQEKIKELYNQLGELAIDWRTKEFRGENGQAEIVEAYHDILSQLEALGWDGGIYGEDLLPPKLLPEPYRSIAEENLRRMGMLGAYQSDEPVEDQDRGQH
jgi:hypothetical protein